MVWAGVGDWAKEGGWAFGEIRGMGCGCVLGLFVGL